MILLNLIFAEQLENHLVCHQQWKTEDLTLVKQKIDKTKEDVKNAIHLLDVLSVIIAAHRLAVPLAQTVYKCSLPHLTHALVRGLARRPAHLS